VLLVADLFGKKDPSNRGRATFNVEEVWSRLSFCASLLMFPCIFASSVTNVVINVVVLAVMNQNNIIYYRRQTGFSGFRRHLLEQSSTTHDICIVARNIQTASQDISLSPVVSGLGHLICSLLYAPVDLAITFVI